MLILRKLRTGPVPPLPAWFDGVLALSRREVKLAAVTWDVYWPDEPWILPDLAALPDDAWIDAGDGWQATEQGRFDARSLLRAGTNLRLQIVTDTQGREWPVPFVLHPEKPGVDFLSMAWRTVDGQTQRVPHPWQEPLLAAARTARTEIDAGRFAETPLSVRAELAAGILAATLHLSPAVVRGLYLDDLLGDAALHVAAGFAPST